MGPSSPFPKGAEPPPLQKKSAHVYCSQTAGWTKMALGHIVLDGDPALLPKKVGKGPRPIFGRCYCGQTAGWIKAPLGMEVGLGPGQVMLDEDPAPPQNAACTAPQFPVHVCCGQTAGWIKMPLGTEVGLGPGHIVLDGAPAPPGKGHSSPPLFCPCLLWPNGWVDQDATWYEGRHWPRPHCVTWVSSSPEKGRSP